MRQFRYLIAFSVLALVGCSDETLVGDEFGNGSLAGEAILEGAIDGPGAKSQTFPDILPLPLGFQPEGIVSGGGTTFFVGSLANGAIYRGDYRTGAGEVLATPPAGRVAVGLAYDARSKFLFVAGGPTGSGYVYDAQSGEPVASFTFASSETFVNDVVVTRDAAYFTDSFRPFLYRVPLGPAGRIPDPGAVVELPLSGDFTFVPGEFNNNGIVASPNGQHLVIVNSTLGALYRVDPSSGDATLIDLGGDAVNSGDGLLLDGRTLYVVQNFFNQIAVVELRPGHLEGSVVDTITDPAFRIPTTVADFGSALYAVNARFDVGPTPDTEYEVVRVSKR